MLSGMRFKLFGVDGGGGWEREDEEDREEPENAKEEGATILAVESMSMESIDDSVEED
jgi:hypothetical protein